MSLATYQKKRQFSKTPEPSGKTAKAHTRLAFVVQKHQASHLHYDFRLELDGTLKSWAVPKGPSLNPAHKRLAMMVEDHPYDYRNFEGTIPKGNYGAGQVIVWDNGTYRPADNSIQPQKSLLAQIKKGHVSFILSGHKLKGEFALIRNKKAGENAWLLIKKQDKYASRQDVTKKTKSVLSNKEITEKKDTEKAQVDVSKEPKQAFPGFVKPMLATLAKQPFNDDDWLYEIKWDGYRALLAKNSKDIKLYSRSNHIFTKFSLISQAANTITGNFIIDGEVVALDSDGKAHFEWLQNWSNKQQGSLRFMVFDILWYNARDVKGLPLIDRKEVIKELLGNSDLILYSDHVIGDGQGLFKLAEQHELEGIMAKRITSSYQDGRRSKDWLKLKAHHRQEAVIGGFTEPRGNRKYLGALILGVYKGNQLQYVGHTGGGIPTDLMPKLRKQLEKDALSNSPFVNSFKPNAPVHWAKPKLVCEVSFSEWTKSGHMRQPIFVGMREDKPAKDVHREHPISNPPEANKTTNAKLTFTHQNKIFWPKHKFTKGDLLDYYRTIAEFILPYIKDRPHSLLRQPNGIKGQSFFQKDTDHSLPDWINVESVYSESNQKNINYLVCNSLDSLLYMVQLGCIEINPWSSRVGSLDKPDWLVIDLDPEKVGFDKVIDTAKTVRKVCDKLEIPSYPKTSGKTGIHVYIPLGAKYTYDQAKQFALLIATLTHQKLPIFTSLERSPKKRQRKIYLDYLQNRKGQTLAAPYSVRPTADATVSTPLDWSEVTNKLRPTDFTIKNILRRLDKKGDIWKPVLGEGIELSRVLAKVHD